MGNLAAELKLVERIALPLFASVIYQRRNRFVCFAMGDPSDDPNWKLGLKDGEIKLLEGGKGEGQHVARIRHPSVLISVNHPLQQIGAGQIAARIGN